MEQFMMVLVVLSFGLAGVLLAALLLKGTAMMVTLFQWFLRAIGCREVKREEPDGRWIDCSAICGIFKGMFLDIGVVGRRVEKVEVLKVDYARNRIFVRTIEVIE
jgi:hypothetical protein